MHDDDSLHAKCRYTFYSLLFLSSQLNLKQVDDGSNGVDPASTCGIVNCSRRNDKGAGQLNRDDGRTETEEDEDSPGKADGGKAAAAGAAGQNRFGERMCLPGALVSGRRSFCPRFARSRGISPGPGPTDGLFRWCRCVVDRAAASSGWLLAACGG